MSENSERQAVPSAAGNMPSGFSEMLEKVLANPQIISTVAAALSSSPDGAAPVGAGQADDASVLSGAEATTPSADAALTGSAASGAPSLDGIADKIPALMNMLGPLLSSSAASGHTGGNNEALLCAVKPYLSDGRREAIDYIIKLSRVSEILKNMG